MRILFCNYSFPGRLAPLAAWLASRPGNEVLFASCFERRNFKIDGVRQVYTKLKSAKTPSDSSQDAFLVFLSGSVRIGRKMQSTLTYLRETGFVPDIILYSSMNGPALFLRQVYPESFMIAYLDEILLKDAESTGDCSQIASDLISIHSVSADMCYAFTKKQIERCPGRLGELYHVLPPAVDDSFFCREQALPFNAGGHTFPGSEKMLSVAVKDEKFVRSRELWKILLEFLQIRKNVHICFSAPKENVKRLIVRALHCLPQELREKTSVLGFLKLEDYRNMLCASSVRLYLADAAITPNELLEASSCGSIVLTSIPPESDDAITSLFPHWSGTHIERLKLLVNAFDLSNKQEQTHGAASPAILSGTFSYKNILPAHFAEIEDNYRKWKSNAHLFLAK